MRSDTALLRSILYFTAVSCVIPSAYCPLETCLTEHSCHMGYVAFSNHSHLPASCLAICTGGVRSFAFFYTSGVIPHLHSYAL